jgi:hypothetical protein
MSNPWGNYTTYSRQLPVFSNFPGISGELRTEKSFCLALRKQTLPGLTLEGEEIALWLLTSLCTSANINEQIKVVHEFDNRLKFDQFDIIREKSAASDANNNPPAALNTNAFERLLSQNGSLPKILSKLDVNAARFTGVYQ